MAPRLSVVGHDNQLHVVRADGTGRSQVTWPKQLDASARWGGVSAEDMASWPCWSPDGRWLACFQVGADGMGAGVAIVEAEGVEERLLHEFTDRLPIHLQWSPDGQLIAVLLQHAEALELWLCSVADGGARLVAEGSPLFFSWTPDAQSLLLHVGDGDGEASRVELRDAVGDGDDLVYRVPPGSFCTPMVAGSGPDPRVVYVVHSGNQSQVVSCNLQGKGLLGLALLPGLAALVCDPSGQHVAVSSAGSADGTPYDGISVVSVWGGEVRRLVNTPVLAFQWTPDGKRIVWCQWGPKRNRLCWYMRAIDGSEGPRRLVDFWPTRSQLFQLHFFEQFARSHPLVSADSKWLVWSGYNDAPKGEDGGGAEVRVLRLDEPDPQPIALGPGSYAVFEAGPPPDDLSGV